MIKVERSAKPQHNDHACILNWDFKKSKLMHMNDRIIIESATSRTITDQHSHAPGCGVVKLVAFTVLTPAQFTAVT